MFSKLIFSKYTSISSQCNTTLSNRFKHHYKTFFIPRQSLYNGYKTITLNPQVHRWNSFHSHLVTSSQPSIGISIRSKSNSISFEPFGRREVRKFQNQFPRTARCFSTQQQGKAENDGDHLNNQADEIDNNQHSDSIDSDKNPQKSNQNQNNVEASKREYYEYDPSQDFDDNTEGVEFHNFFMQSVKKPKGDAWKSLAEVAQEMRDQNKWQIIPPALFALSCCLSFWTLAFYYNQKDKFKSDLRNMTGIDIDHISGKLSSWIFPSSSNQHSFELIHPHHLNVNGTDWTLEDFCEQFLKNSGIWTGDISPGIKRALPYAFASFTTLLLFQIPGIRQFLFRNTVHITTSGKIKTILLSSLANPSISMWAIDCLTFLIIAHYSYENMSKEQFWALSGTAAVVSALTTHSISFWTKVPRLAEVKLDVFSSLIAFNAATSPHYLNIWSGILLSILPFYSIGLSMALKKELHHTGVLTGGLPAIAIGIGAAVFLKYRNSLFKYNDDIHDTQQEEHAQQAK